MYKNAGKFLRDHPGCQRFMSGDPLLTIKECRNIVVTFSDQLTNQRQRKVFRREHGYATCKFAQKKFTVSHCAYVELHVDGEVVEQKGNPEIKLKWEQELVAFIA